MEIFVKMSDMEYEAFKKAMQRKEPAEMNIESFLRLKGYRLTNDYIQTSDKPDERYAVWENKDEKILVLIKKWKSRL